VRIEVGQPQPIPFDEKKDWFCPVFIEGFTPHVVPAFGVGPIDSLMNAVTILRAFHDHIAIQQISHRQTGAKRPARKVPKKHAKRRSAE
jgi:hypothetical protein